MYGDGIIDQQQPQATHIKRVLSSEWYNTQDLHRSPFWYQLQRSYRCCGLTNMSDYNDHLPVSCCESRYANYIQTITQEYSDVFQSDNGGDSTFSLHICKEAEAFQTGCVRTLVMQAYYWSRLLNTFAYCVAFTAILGCLLAYSCGSNRKDETAVAAGTIESIDLGEDDYPKVQT